MKLSIAIDVDNQQILSYRIHQGPRHDSKDFQQLLKGLELSMFLRTRVMIAKNIGYLSSINCMLYLIFLTGKQVE